MKHPYSGKIVATLPKATLDDVRRALRMARDYRSTLTRHDRYRILTKAGEPVAHRRDEIGLHA